MDPVTLIKTTRTVIKYGTKVVDYIRDDQNARMGLLQPVRITIEGPGLGIGDFQSSDHVFTMLSDTLNRVNFIIAPFPADAKTIWNGPDGIPNTWEGGSIPASLVHDFICHHRPGIAGELNITQAEVWEWAAKIMAIIWEHYGHSTTQARTESWIAYNIVRNVRRPYTWLKRKLGFATVIILASLLTGCSGCLQSLPEGRVTYADPVISVEQGIVTTNAPPAIQ